MIEKINSLVVDVIKVLEKPKRTGWSNSLRDSLDMLKDNPKDEDALDYLYSACTSPRGLQDVWVQDVSQDEWYALLSSLQDAVDEYRAALRY